MVARRRIKGHVQWFWYIWLAWGQSTAVHWIWFFWDLVVSFLSWFSLRGTVSSPVELDGLFLHVMTLTFVVVYVSLRVLVMLLGFLLILLWRRYYISSSITL